MQIIEKNLSSWEKILQLFDTSSFSRLENHCYIFFLAVFMIKHLTVVQMTASVNGTCHTNAHCI